MAFVQLQSGDDHLAGANAHMRSCTLSFLPRHSFSVSDVFLPVNLHYFANLLPFVMSSDNLNVIILSDGHVLLSSWEREDVIFSLALLRWRQKGPI